MAVILASLLRGIFSEVKVREGAGRAYNPFCEELLESPTSIVICEPSGTWN